MPGYTADNAPDETSYLTNWHRFDEREGTLVRSVSMVMDYTDGYSFLVPDMWRGKVSTRMDAATRTLTFYEWVVADETTGSGAMGAALLRLQVFTKDKWENRREQTAIISWSITTIWCLPRRFPHRITHCPLLSMI